METYEIQGDFSGNVQIYYYPSLQDSKKVILVLKGLYSAHIPNEKGDGVSWDNEIIMLLNREYHLVFLKTSRLGEKEGQEAFNGKTFQNECNEIEAAFKYVKESIFQDNFLWSGVGMSFGGTLFLGMPEVLSQMRSLIFIGSGCGKSSNTTKPLLESLPEMERLLRSLDNYSGSVFFLHGEHDTVVPVESQRFIYKRSKKSLNREWIELPGLDHQLQDINTKESHASDSISKYVKRGF